MYLWGEQIAGSRRAEHKRDVVLGARRLYPGSREKIENLTDSFHISKCYKFFHYFDSVSAFIAKSRNMAVCDDGLLEKHMSRRLKIGTPVPLQR